MSNVGVFCTWMCRWGSPGVAGVADQAKDLTAPDLVADLDRRLPCCRCP